MNKKSLLNVLLRDKGFEISAPGPGARTFEVHYLAMGPGGAQGSGSARIVSGAPGVVIDPGFAVTRAGLVSVDELTVEVAPDPVIARSSPGPAVVSFASALFALALGQFSNCYAASHDVLTYHTTRAEAPVRLLSQSAEQQSFSVYGG